MVHFENTMFGLKKKRSYVNNDSGNSDRVVEELVAAQCCCNRQPGLSQYGDVLCNVFRFLKERTFGQIEFSSRDISNCSNNAKQLTFVGHKRGKMAVAVCS